MMRVAAKPYLIHAAVIAILLLMHFILPAYHHGVLARVMVLAVFAMGYNLLFGYTGLLNFGGLAGQNYWVYDHAPDYSWAIMGLPDKSNWWIWHRNQNATQAERDRILSRVRALGFSTSRLVHTGL